MTTQSQSTQSQALLPCPFCGAHLRAKSEGRGYWHPAEGDCPLALFAMEADGYSETRWNRRATLRASTDAAAVGVDVKAERAAFETWWRMWCPDRDMPPVPSHIFDAWLARARSAHPPVADAAVAGEDDRNKLTLALRGNITPIIEWEMIWKEYRPENADDDDMMEGRRAQRDYALDCILAALSHPAPAEPVGLREAIKTLELIRDTDAPALFLREAAATTLSTLTRTDEAQS